MDSLLLDVAIGLALVFFTTALLADAVNEIVSRSLNIRSKALWARLDELLSSRDQGLGYSFIFNGPFSKLRPEHRQAPSGGPPNLESMPEPDKPTARLEALANAPSIHALDYVSAGKKTKVWKISGDVFASALIELAGAGSDQKELAERIKDLAGEFDKTPLGEFLKTTGKDLATSADTFIDGVGRWFDGQMQVLSNTYRRNVRLILAVIGVVIAVVFNVNAVTIGQQLASNAALRESAVVIAGELTAEEVEGCEGKEGEELYTCAAEQIALFDDAGVLVPLSDNYGTQWVDTWQALQDPIGWVLQILGIAVTAAAVSFGGTFWFDTLRFLTGVRRKQ